MYGAWHSLCPGDHASDNITSGCARASPFPPLKLNGRGLGRPTIYACYEVMHELPPPFLRAFSFVFEAGRGI